MDTAFKKSSRVVILGTAGTRGAAPFEDDDFDIWAVSPALSYPDVKNDKINAVFELHPKRYWGDATVMQRLLDYQGPIFMQEVVPEIPNSIEYPYVEVKEKFYTPAMKGNLYATNTISWMIALALMYGYEEIHLYGVHMASDEEYAHQRPSCEYFLGVAAGMGYGDKIFIPDGSALLKCGFEYGFGEPKELINPIVTQDVQALELGYNQLVDRKKQADEAAHQAELDLAKQAGGIEYAKRLLERLRVK